jgi:RNA polymerase sigma-70 factor (ECF subfamily)
VLTREGAAHLTDQHHHREGVGTSVGVPTPDRAAAFEEFYRRHATRLVGFLLHLGASSAEAADVTQETMISIYTKWDRIEQPERYMYTTARRAYWRAMESVRRQTPTSDIPALVDAVSGEEVPSAETSVMSQLQYSRVVKAVAALPERQRSVLTMSLNGVSTEEIAQRTGSTASSVGSNLHLARRALRRWFLEEERSANTPSIPRQRTAEHDQILARAETVVARDAQVEPVHGNQEDGGSWAAAQEQFTKLLQQVRLEAGSPSFRELAKRGKDGPSVSTMYRIVYGRHLSNWANVRSYLLACGVDPHEIDTLWQRRWAEVARLAGAGSPHA